MARSAYFSALLCSGILAACSSQPAPLNVHAVHAQDVTTPGVVEARGPDELRVLEVARELETGKSTKVGDLTVIAQAPYRSASGRNCRSLVLSPKDGSLDPRLVCTEHLIGDSPGRSPDDPKTKWVFVPLLQSQLDDSPLSPAASAATPAMVHTPAEESTPLAATPAAESAVAPATPGTEAGSAPPAVGGDKKSPKAPPGSSQL